MIKDKNGWMSEKKSQHGSLPNQIVSGISLQNSAEGHFWGSRGKDEFMPKTVFPQS